MLLDFAEIDQVGTDAAIVIVGAGAVGLILGVQLAKCGRRVVIVESGGHSFESGVQALNEAEVVGRPHLGIAEGRGRLLGGTTNLWGGQLLAFDPLDFEARPWMGAEAWPIQRSDIESYYAKAALALGLDSKAGDDDQIWSELALRKPDLGPSFTTILTRWMREPKLARHFASELKSNQNIKVLLHATCVDIDFSTTSGAVEGVVVAAPDGGRHSLRAEKVILASGTIESCRLMLTVASRHPSTSWAGNAWLGRGFQDHLDVRAGTVEVINRTAFQDTFDNILLRGYKYQPKIAASSHLQRSAQISNISASFISESSASEHLSNLKIAARSLLSGATQPNLRGAFAGLVATARVWAPLVRRYMRDHRIMSLSDKGIYLNLHCEQIPLASSCIYLSETRHDAFGQPKAVLDWRIDGRELDAMQRFTTMLALRLEQIGLARIHLHPMLQAADTRFLDNCSDTNHHCGGLRMANDASQGVVDENLKVHGISNLYVAGAAVFPSSSFANPTFTAMALALRLADHLIAS